MKLTKYISKTRIASFGGAAIVGLTKAQAEQHCALLGGHLPHSEDFCAAPTPLITDRDLWSWCANNPGEGNKFCVIGAQNMVQSSSPDHRSACVGFHCAWDDASKIPTGIEVIAIEKELPDSAFVPRSEYNFLLSEVNRLRGVNKLVEQLIALLQETKGENKQ